MTTKIVLAISTQVVLNSVILPQSMHYDSLMIRTIVKQQIWQSWCLLCSSSSFGTEEKTVQNTYPLNVRKEQIVSWAPWNVIVKCEKKIIVHSNDERWMDRTPAKEAFWDSHINHETSFQEMHCVQLSEKRNFITRWDMVTIKKEKYNTRRMKRQLWIETGEKGHCPCYRNALHWHGNYPEVSVSSCKLGLQTEKAEWVITKEELELKKQKREKNWQDSIVIKKMNLNAGPPPSW